MKRFLKIFCYFFLTIGCSLFGELKVPEIVAATEGEPSTIIGGCVNAITGDLIFSNEDIVVEGEEPIRLKRIYVSGDGVGYNGGWEFFPHATLFLRHYINTPEWPQNYSQVAEPWGASLRYIYQQDSGDYYVLKLNVGKQGVGLTNTAGGIISGRTNLKNNTYSFHQKLFSNMDKLLRKIKERHPERVHATVRTGNGTLRTYQCITRTAYPPSYRPTTARFY